MDSKKKAILVTGASKGIGRAIALAFAKEGYMVVINFKSDAKGAQEVLAECNKYSENNITLQADVSDENSVRKMINKIKTQFTTLDVLVNNAGIFDEDDSPINLKAFENIYKNNFLSCVMVTKYTLEIMKTGKIVNVSSVHAKLGYGRPTAIAYSAFKAGLESYTKNLAKQLAPDILVNAVSPGRVVTQMWDNPDEEGQKRLGRIHLIRRMIQPDEIADAVVFLAKNDAICGEILTVDGGMSLVTLG